MDQNTIKYPSLSNVYHDLTLWFKLDGNKAIALSDIPKVAEGRWFYFVDNWDFIKSDYLKRIQALQNGPGKVAALEQHTEFSNLILSSRASSQNPLSNPSNMRSFKDLFDNILITDVQLTQSERTLVNNEVQRVVQLTKDDFYQMRERVRITHDKLIDSFGMGDAGYNELLGRVSGEQIMSFQFKDFQVIYALVSLMNTLTSMLPAKFVQNEQPDPFFNIRKALNNAAIPMDSYTSGYLVPFPAGSTLQRVAQEQLGDAGRWMEIVVANGLEFPYVDEVGRRAQLVVNGVGNILVVSIDEASNFAISDEIFVGSNALALSRRVIQSITQDNTNSQLILTVDGPADLGRYTTPQGAFVFYYQRNTINSSKFLMIPSDNGGAGFPINSELPWFAQTLPPDQQQMGIDLAINADNDLVFDNTGDFQLVYGLANATQAANTKMNVKAGELMNNPSFGLQEIAGKFNNSEITTSLLTMLIESAMSGDDRFDGTDAITYSVTNQATFVSASIRLAGTNSSIPLTFKLPKG